MKRYIIGFITFLLLITLVNYKISFAQNPDAKFQGVMIYHFTQQITWPASKGNFIIGVLGTTPLSAVLQEIAKKRDVKGKRILVRKFTSVDQISSCNIIFLTKAQKGNLSNIIAKVKNDKTLVIAESPGSAKQGASINFVKRDGKIKFEINKGSITASGLKLSPTLEKLAVKVI